MTHILPRICFSSFHHNSFRDTISWECVVKDDCGQSCLIELKSFLLSKFYVDLNVIRISVIFVHGIHRRKEYRLSFAQKFVLPVSILYL